MTDLIKYGFTREFEQQITKEDLELELIPARVTSIQKETYRIVSSKGENNGKLKGSIFYQDSRYITYPAVGDFVLIKPNPMGDDIIYRVLERTTCFSRHNPTLPTKVSKESEQIVAANFDYVFIMASLNHDFNLRRLERYLAVAMVSGATPVIVLTKADLCPNYADYINDINMTFPEIDVRAISAHTGFGMDKLEKYIVPTKTIVFLGSSGVGKSSLVNALANEDLMKVNIIREDDSKGLHTTTYRQLFLLKNDVIIIDTPGMRELGLWDVNEGIKESFSDIESLSKTCKFNDCKHEKEPGCAIQAALKNGSLTKERLNSYQKLLREARHSARKAAFLKMKANEAKNHSKNQKSTRRKEVYSAEDL